MNEAELREFVEKRKPSEHRSFKTEDLVCYGCAHSAAGLPFPSRPSGERPCCTCIRNKEREEWGEDKKEMNVLIDTDGNARCFNPFMGFAYNGAPYVHFPMDNYVTLDQRDQERFYEAHPEYTKPIRFIGDNLVVVDE